MPSLYDFTVVPMRKALSNQVAILKKAAEWSQESTNESDPANLASAQLVPDMFALPFHVQFGPFWVANMLTELKIVDKTPIPGPSPHSKPTFDELIALLEQTISYLDAEIKPSMFDGADDRKVDVKAGDRVLETVTALEYAQDSTLPGFWFHHGMVYAILRQAGVPLQKRLFVKGF